MEQLRVQCAIAGGGPAGVMLGFLLARAGVEVAVCEKWPDFFRDFRGDTIHPSTMELLHELGLLQEFLKLPHDETAHVEADIGEDRIVIADFSRLSTRCPFIAFMPQWDFLNFLSEHARRYPVFHLYMETEVEDLIEESGRVVGLHTKGKNGALEIRADLVVGADGRHSVVRARSGIKSADLGAPMDVLWFRISRKPEDPAAALGRVDHGHMMVMLDRSDYWQCGFIIPKGQWEEFKAQGLSAFRATLARLQPFLAGRVGEIADWSQVKLLSVSVERVETWHKKGLLLIGDAAHAMSPIGGVGINLAIQDAVAAANILAPKFLNGAVAQSDLAALERRRCFPTRVTQRVQIFIQNRLIRRVLASQGHMRAPFFMRVLKRVPALRGVPAHLIGIGVRPEHIHTPSPGKAG